MKRFLLTILAVSAVIAAKGDKIAVFFADLKESDTEFTASHIVRYPGVNQNTSINGEIFKVGFTEDGTATNVCSFMFMGEDTSQTDFCYIYRQADGATRPLLNWSKNTSLVFNIPTDIAITKITMQCTSAKNYTQTLSCNQGTVSTSDKFHTWNGNAGGVLKFRCPDAKVIRLQCIEIEYEKLGNSPAAVFPLKDWNTHTDTWVAVDELGRKVAMAGDGIDREEVDKDVSVGMFYYIWHGYHNEFDRSVTDLLEENASNPSWGADKQFHWSAKPWLGYYHADDRYVIARHMQMLSDAGVDFLFLDCTNAFWYPAHVLSVMNEIDRRTALGLKSPKLTFCLNTKTPRTLKGIYDLFYKSGEYDRFWFYYDNKPLILADKNAVDTNGETVADELKEFFTFRHSWAWMGGDTPECWSWLENYPQEPGWTNDGGGKKIEQITVGVAQHAHSKIGKSFHNGVQPSFDEKGLCKETPYGYYFQEQWDRAMEIHAPIVMITQFNEWIAQRFIIDENTPLSYVRPGAQGAVGETYFIDVYNSEFSRDIEPSTHPLIRDNYYLQLVSNIRKYRGADAVPAPSTELSIDIKGAFDQWDAETVEYRDDPGDTEFSSASVQTPSTLKRPTNDLLRSKVTQDDHNVYFYVQTVEALYPFEEADLWMRLLLNTDCDYSTGWGGYDYCVYKDTSTGLYSLMKNTGGFNWQTVAPVEYRIQGNQMHLSIPRTLIGLSGRRDIDFKWADNISDDQSLDIMTFISDGDVAPNGRFNYRYRGSAAPASADEITTDNSCEISYQISRDGITVRNMGTESCPISIINTLGQTVFYSVLAPTSAANVNLSAGIYILQTSNQRTSKFMIK